MGYSENRVTLLECALSALLLVPVLLVSIGLAGEADATREAAISLANQGRADSAVAVLTRYIEDNPDDKETRLVLGTLHDYNGNPTEAIDILEAGLDGTGSDVELLRELGILHARLGEEGPNMVHRWGSVICRPSEEDQDEEAFKRAHLRLAVEAYEALLTIKPSASEVSYELACLLLDMQEEERAKRILEDLAEDLPGDSEILVKLAGVYMDHGESDAALDLLEQAIAFDPRAVRAHAALGKYYIENGDSSRSENHLRQARFYAWLAPFVDLPYSPASYDVCMTLSRGWWSGDKEDPPDSKRRVRMIDSLMADGSDSSLGFLATLCYNHSDHGEIEIKAFRTLEEHSEDGIPLLLDLLTNAKSICTIRQAGAALARLGVSDAVEPLIRLLPSDNGVVWIANVAECLGELGDVRAVPALIEIADVTHTQESSIDDGLYWSKDRLSARYRAIVALGAFRSQSRVVSEELNKGLENPQVAAACLAGLYRLTGDGEYLRELERAVAEDDGLGRFRLLAALRDSNEPDLKAFATENQETLERLK
jgi:tetratricopeptide (TPR) repeat protein